MRLDPTKPKNETNYVGYIKMTLASSSHDRDFNFAYTPKLVTSKYLSVAANNDDFCSNTHPNKSQ